MEGIIGTNNLTCQISHSTMILKVHTNIFILVKIVYKNTYPLMNKIKYILEGWINRS